VFFCDRFSEMSSHEDEEDEGPSVDSADREERIQARRLRINRRVELAQRKARGEDPDQKKPTDSEKDVSKSRKQMEESRQRLTKLRTDGTELVSNVQVAGDAREGIRRLEEDEIRRQRVERLEAEAKAAAEKFEEITKKWDYALSKEVPQDLFAMHNEQKDACDGMIDEKNKLINELQQELKGKDDQYVKDLKKEAEDVDLMLERMEEQVKNLTKAYREELTQVEKAFVAERTELLQNNKKKWDTLMLNRHDKEVEYMDSRRKRVEDHENQLQVLRVQDAEEYNMVKIKLETDVQILEQQLQQMKATYQLNQEKLEYNFQVLKKRDEENTITKSQQKRKITRLQDVLNNMKSKLAKQEKSYKEENQALTDDYKRITEQYRELQKKFRHFMLTDQKKFQDIWEMNEEQVKKLVEKVLEEDRIIHEQQLGLRWNVPDLEFMNRVGPVRGKTEKQLSATETAMEIMSAASEADTEGQKAGSGDGEQSSIHCSERKPKLSPRTVKRILELLCDESGFLIESKLAKLLQPLEKDEQSLMKLDAIFAALGVETEEDVYELASYFLRQLADEEGSVLSEGQELPEDEDREEFREDGAERDGDGDERKGSQDETGSQIERGSVASSSISKQSEVPELIHANNVVKALRTFVHEHHTPAREGKPQSVRHSHASSQGDGLDADYWNKMAGIIDEKKECLWTALEDAFEKYLSTLTERASLIQETESLQQQNAELRMLLHQYVNSKVNQELQIPPTKILQMELAKDL